MDDKSNEITAIPQLLKILDLVGCMVVDTIGTQGKIAKTIIDQEADYILAVTPAPVHRESTGEENQGHLDEDIHDLVEEDWKHKNRDRIEIRQCWSISDP